MKVRVERGFAKINLHLDITRIMDNGFHAVNNVMQSVSLCDEVTVALRTDGEYTVACNVEGVPTDARNLAVRAALAFEAAIGKRLGADITINKSIPMAAGLAGGSADAAAVLRAMNFLCGSPLSTEQLCRVGGALGADVPFCIVGGSAFADGKGDILHPFPSMPDCFLVVACGGEGVSTPEAYGMLDGLYGNFSPESGYSPRDLSPLSLACEAGDIRRVGGCMYNIFEAPILSVRPVAQNIKSTLLCNGAISAMMSGSGPSVFGIFEDEATAKRACEAIRALGVTPHLCRPIG